jgi:hypothetical protein
MLQAFARDEEHVHHTLIAQQSTLLLANENETLEPDHTGTLLLLFMLRRFLDYIPFDGEILLTSKSSSQQARPLDGRSSCRFPAQRKLIWRAGSND